MDIPSEAMLTPWTGVFRWPGREPFRAGTVFIRAKAPDHEVVAALEREFDAMFARILPDAWAKPDMIDYQPGALVFVPAQDLPAPPRR